ncbi:MAG: F0F1 ATP synthase subunit delta [Dehalococcoidia bacterium]|nr:F0F1 ATP synthase subunit delta [Dehalococcoidia bacterium]MDW8119422.1 F0F1 ATP synthase subunit delta [Chloroflexota bacterium]
MPGRSLPSPKRYAQAVWDIAREQGTVDTWRRDLQAMAELARREEVVAFLDNPSIPVAERVALVRQMLPDLGPLAYNLGALLAERQGFRTLPLLFQEFQRLADEAEGILRVEVTAGAPLTDSDQQDLAERLGRTLGKRVVLSVRTDPSLLGGVVLRIGDRVLDGSVRGRLQALRKTLVEVG